MAKRSAREEDSIELLERGRIALGVSPADLARLLGVSPKTVWRWLGRRTTMATQHLGALALLVHPHDAALAARIHAFASAWLIERGFEPPEPLPVPVDTTPKVEAPVLPMRLRVETVVYAACKASNTTPVVATRAILAALRRAREVGISVDDLERELEPAARSKKAAPAR